MKFDIDEVLAAAAVYNSNFSHVTGLKHAIWSDLGVCSRKPTALVAWYTRWEPISSASVLRFGGGIRGLRLVEKFSLNDSCSWS